MKSTVTMDVDTIAYLRDLSETDQHEELHRRLVALEATANGDRRGLEVRLTWTGSSASAALMVDEINRADVTEARGSEYASADRENGYYPRFDALVVDTVSGRYTMSAGDTLVSTPDGGWVVEKAPDPETVTITSTQAGGVS